MKSIQRLDDLIVARLQLETPSFVLANRERKSGAQQAGLVYEKHVHRHLRKEFPSWYLPSPWFSYSRRQTPTVTNYAQTDGLIILPRSGRIIIVEAKKRHCAESYFQLVDKYLPLVSKCFGSNWTYSLIEICEWYDPSTSYPVKVRLQKSILDAQPDEISVHIWRPKKKYEELLDECEG